MILGYFVQAASRRRRSGATAYLRHFGAAGLFFLAILDSSPIPTFGGPDILVAILSASHRNPWYEYAIVATLGSTIGAWLTFRLARRTGLTRVQSKFKEGRFSALMRIYQEWGTTALAVSTAVPLPFPTSVFFGAAGATKYSLRKFVIVVALCRAARYSFIAILAEHYGRHFVRVIRHPDQEWRWLLLFVLIVIVLVVAAARVNKTIEAHERG